MSQELLDAVKNKDDLDEITLLLDDGAVIDYQDDNGMTALHEATLNLDTDRMELLLERGAAVDLQDGYGMTALNHVYFEYINNIESEILPAINVLLRFGANPIHPDSSGDTLMQWAAFNGHQDIVKRLLLAGVDAHDALDDAIEGRHQPIIKLLQDSILEANISMSTEIDDNSRPRFF